MFDKAAHITQKTLREFQKDANTISPGPGKYVCPYDPSKELPSYKRPLSGQESFIDFKHAQGVLSKELRSTFFGGKSRVYDHDY